LAEFFRRTVRALKSVSFAALVVLAAAPNGLAQDGNDAASLAAARAAQACVPAEATVTRASLVSRRGRAQKPRERVHVVQLEDEIALTVDGLDAIVACLEKQPAVIPLVLFLEGRPLSDLPAFPPRDLRTGQIHFVLEITDESQDTWDYLLGFPQIEPKAVRASIGLQGFYPLPSTAELKLRTLPRGWLLAWVVVLGALGVAFWWCVRHTNILRDGQSESPQGEPTGLYSLSRSQAAWWFFFVLIAYLLIGMVTGDFADSINATALTLLGIGAGTAVAAAAIGSSQDTAAARAGETAAIAAARLEIQTLREQLATIEQQAPPSDAAAMAALLQLKADKQARLAAAESKQRKLLGESEGFFTDIVSDANGASFHRFQMIAWTVILSIVFIREVYANLAMPEFSATLLGLQGLSAATYLGLKVNEAQVPSK
jgi:hypothetical protein